MTNNKIIIKYLITCLICLIISGCRKSETFTVSGVVAGGAGQTLYLENTGLTTVTTLDSVKIKPDGKFSFRQPRPEYPDFYRLKLNNQTIHFSVDSTETVTFTADVNNFAFAYTVEGSENSKAFKEITLAQLDADQELRRLRDSFGMNLITDSAYQAGVIKAVEAYKEVALKFIYGAPLSTAAYFALFQQFGGALFFDIFDSADSKAFAAVATSYKTFQPTNPRSKQLENLALQSIKAVRDRQKKLILPNAVEVSYIDIELPNINDKNIKLSEIAPGKAVLVVFTVFQQDWAPTFHNDLNMIYRRFKDKGFEVYHVSLDSDAHFWKNAAYNLPWVTVRDPQSIYSSTASIYNVRQLPALFLIDSKGNLMKRFDSLNAIESEIQAAL